MSLDRNKILDKAKKLKELADRGIDGEQDNAKEFLAKYMSKHKISMSELNSHKMSDEYENMTDHQFANLMLFELLEFGIITAFNMILGAKNPFPKLKEGSILHGIVSTLKK